MQDEQHGVRHCAMGQLDGPVVELCQQGRPRGSTTRLLQVTIMNRRNAAG